MALFDQRSDRFFKWRYLINDQIAFSKGFQIDSVGYMIRMFSPIYVYITRVAITSAKTPLNVSDVMPATIAERLFEMIMRLLTLLAAVGLISTIKIAPGSVILWLGVFMLIFVLINYIANRSQEFIPRLSSWLKHIPRLSDKQVDGSLSSFQGGLETIGSGQRLLVALAISLAMWGVFLVYHALVFSALHFRLDLKETLALSIAILAFLTPSNPPMIGVYQGMLLIVLTPFDLLDSSELTAYALLAFGVQLVFWCLSGIWSLRRLHLNIREVVHLPSSNLIAPEQDQESPEKQSA
ncbi:MAG: lysylphosphatidylglycerol synthase transmembrane domain-containing protein [Anaerolineales bacterium]